MKFNYTVPSLRIAKFNAEDVVTTSGLTSGTVTDAEDFESAANKVQMNYANIKDANFTF